MAKVRLSAEAQADYEAIMDYLEKVGGPTVSERYRLDFIAAFDRISAFPGIGAPRRKFGTNTRLIVISPYSIYYEGRPKGDDVLVLRIVRGRRRVTRRLLGTGRKA